MYYIKITIQSLLLLVIVACSSTTSSDKTPLSSQSPKSTKSTKIELAVYTEALIALNNNELDKAQKLFTKMSELQPDIAGSWANLAVISIKKEQYDKAEKFINSALEKNPKMVQALNLSGSLEQRKGNILKAKSLYQQALSYKPNYPLAHYNLAFVYDIYFQDIPNAINHYQLYLDNIDVEDKETAQWLANLKAIAGVQ